MNVKKGLICGLIIIFLCIGFTGCIEDSGIWVEKLDYEPERYINITSEQLEEYPSIKECVIVLNSDNYNGTVKYVSCNKDEQKKIETLFGGFYGENFFKYQDEYYSLGYHTT